jgi:23S rRNA pseudouridine1911/1915/1917 synthase
MNPIKIIFEDDFLIVINKPAGVPVQNDKTGDPSIQLQLEQKLGQSLFILNRVDRPVSGLTLFAKNKDIASSLSILTQEKKIKKSYLAAVENEPVPNQGRLTHILEKKKNKAYVTRSSKGGKTAELDYRLIGKSNRYYFIEIDLITGRFHQIRAQLASINCPVKGDVKYGARRSNPDRSIHLHAWKMEFLHPVSNAPMVFSIKPADDPVWNALELTLS